MKYTIQNFTGTLKDGNKYIVEVEETNNEGTTTILAKISRFDKDQRQYRYYDHTKSTEVLWRDALYDALLRLELKYEIELTKLQLEE
jgi:hypothetical protein